MLRLGLIIGAGVVVADQIVKLWAIAGLPDAPDGVVITPFLTLTLIWNRGISFGMFGGGALPPWLLAGLAAAVVAGLVYWLRQADDRWMAASIGLIIGGAVGNIIDRIAYGAVADFFLFHAGGYAWPAFNIADAAITGGVIYLLIDALLIRREKHN